MRVFKLYLLFVLIIQAAIHTISYCSPIELTLEDAIEIALEKSYSMKSIKLNLIQAGHRLTVAKGRFKTNASLGFNLPEWRESVSQIPVPDGLPIYNTTGQLRYNGTLRIGQPLPTDGEISLSSRLYHNDFKTYLSADDSYLKSKDVMSSVRVDIQQPLFTINKLKLGLKEANLDFELASKRYTQEELRILFQVTEAFFNYYRAIRNSEIAEETVKQQQSLYDITQKKYETGLIPEVDALTMEVDLADAKNDQMSAIAQRERIRNYFLQLIGLNFSDSISVKPTFEFHPSTVDLHRMLEHGIENRVEIREGEINIELAKIDIKQADSWSEIRGELWAFYDLTGVSDPFMEYNSSPYALFESSLEDLQNRPRNRGVGFTLSIPLWDSGVNKAQVANAEASLMDKKEYLKEIKKDIEREIRNAVDKLHETEHRLIVLKKREDVAQRVFDITLHRFDIGGITSQDLALNRDRLTDAKTAYLQAYIDYKLAVADLKQKTLYDFETGKSLVK